MTKHVFTRDTFQVMLEKPLKGCSLYYVVKTMSHEHGGVTWSVSDMTGRVVKDQTVRETVIKEVG